MGEVGAVVAQQGLAGVVGTAGVGMTAGVAGKEAVAQVVVGMQAEGEVELSWHYFLTCAVQSSGPRNSGR